MKSPLLAVLAVLVVLFLLAALAAGFWLLSASGTSDHLPQTQRSTGPSTDPPVNEVSQTPIKVESPSAGPDAALARALKELGIPERAAPEGYALVAGRIASPDVDPSSDKPAPVPGALVSVHRVGADGGVDALAVQSLSARDDGRFLLSVAKTVGVALQVSCEGFGTTQVRISTADLADGGHAAGELIILKNAIVRVTVTTGVAELGETVEPVKDLDVSLLSGVDEVIASGKTLTDGTMTFADVPRGSFTVKGHRAPLRAFENPIVVDRPEIDVAINIQLVGSLRIRARTEAGASLKQFSVSLDIQRGREEWLDPRFEAVETNADGWAIVDDVKVGTWNLFATAAGFALARQDEIEILAGEMATVEVTLPSGFQVSGIVLSKEDDQPIAGAVVFSEKDFIPASVYTHTGDGFEPAARATRADARGRFTLKDLSAGNHDLSAIHPEYAASRVDGVEVGANVSRETDPVLRLGRGAELSGHCYDPEGRPRDGIQVMVFSMMDRNVDRKIPLIAVTDDDGFYRITRIAPAASGVLRMDPEGSPPTEFKMTLFRDGQKKVLNFGEATQGATLVGRILDGSGAPAPNVGVMVIGEPGGSGGLPPIYQSASGSDGAYRITGIPEGAYQLHVSPGNVGGNFVGIGNVALPADGEVLRDIELSDGRISGLVLSKKERRPPKQGEVILLKTSGEFAGRCVLERDGSYAFNAVLEGEYIVAASAQDHESEQSAVINVKAGRHAKVRDILVSAGGRLTGVVLDAAGAPVEGAQIVLIDPKTGEEIPAWSLGSSAEGVFEAKSVPVGAYQVTARKNGLTFVPVPIQVNAGGATTTTLRAQ